MKPIEIHIEGYKIVISEDKETEVTKENTKMEEDKEAESTKENTKMEYVPYPVTTPTYPYSPSVPNSDWWRYPYVTWSVYDVTFTNTSN